MQVHVFAVFTGILIIAVAIPGPAIVAVVSCALGRGFRDAVAMTCGMVLGDLIYFSLAVFGLAALAHSMGKLFLLVKLGGAAYLVWLGFKLWRIPSKVVAPQITSSPSRGFGRSLMTGLTVTLSNPKAMAFYAGLLPTVVNLDQLSGEDGLVMGLIVVAVVGGVPTLYAFTAATFFSAIRRV